MSERILNQDSAAQTFDDLVLRIAVSSYMEIEGDKLLEELSETEQDERYKLPDAEKKKMLRIIRKHQFIQSFRLAEKHFFKLGRHLSVIFMALFIVASASTVASAGVRDWLYKIIFQHEKQYTLIKISTELVDNPVKEIYTLENAYVPNKLPVGYKYKEHTAFRQSNEVIYQNQTGKEISFWQFKEDNIQVDSQNADVVQHVLINGNEALLVVKKGEVSLTWSVEDMMIHLITEESIDTTLAIAQHISAV